MSDENTMNFFNSQISERTRRPVGIHSGYRLLEIDATEGHEASKLNFHIWNANSQSFALAKNEAKMAAHCTLVSILFAVLYVSSSPLHDFHETTMKKVHRRNITGPVLHIRVFKRIRYCRVA